MTENPIRKRAMTWAWALATNKIHAVRMWVAACPSCGTETRGSHTRKQAKDELYRHQQKQHEPGSVGRA